MTAILIVVGLMVLGIALLAVEILLIPGIGVVGLLGGAAVVAAGWVAYAQVGAGYGAASLVGGLVAAGVLLWLAPKTKLGKSMVLRTATQGTAANPALALLKGREGVVLSPLRPSGSIEIDGRPVDVVSDGRFVEAGTVVRVIRVEGARVVVEPVDT
jgi:membrane-bound ClpP family serine protease